MLARSRVLQVGRSQALQPLVTEERAPWQPDAGVVEIDRELESADAESLGGKRRTRSARLKGKSRMKRLPGSIEVSSFDLACVRNNYIVC